MKTLKLLVLGAALISGLTACPRENIIFSTDPRIVRGNWAGSAKRVCADVSQTAWSPDGTKIVSNGKRTVIWDAVTGARVRVIAASSQQVVWTATGIITVSGPTYLENASGMVVKFWNSGSGVLERSLTITGNALAISPDGTRGAVNAFENTQGSARVISLQNGASERSLGFAPDTSYFGFSWTADGARIIASANRQVLTAANQPTPVQPGIRVWNASTGEVERDLLDASRVSSSPDGKILAYSDTVSGELKFLNLETGVSQTIPETNAYAGLSWNSSGSKVYLAFPYEGAVRVWNMGTLALEKTFSEPGIFGWDSLGAPADTGVAPYAQSYDPSAACNLKILDLKTLKTTRTLDETTLDARKGEITLLIGPNGAGKSTVLKTLFGLLTPRSGEVRFEGKVINGKAQRDLLADGIAFVPQGRNLFGSLSVRHNLELGGITLPRGLLPDRIEEVLQRFPRIRERLDNQASTMSGGEQKQLEVGRALLLRPRVLLIDEPSIGLSPKLVQEVMALLRGLADTGVTVLMVEQNVRTALKYSNRALVLEMGRLALDRPASELLHDPDLNRLFLGGHAKAPAAAA